MKKKIDKTQKTESVKAAARTISLQRFYFKKFLKVTLGILFLLTFISLLMAPHIFKVIKAGHGGVLYHPLGEGTVTDKALGEGFYILFPWNSMHIYDVRTQELTHKVVVLDNHGLSIQVEVSSRYRPIFPFLGKLHKEIGPDYAEKIIRPQLGSAIREVIGHYKAEDLYYKKRGMIQKQILAEAYLMVGAKYIFMEDVLLRSIVLPPQIVSAIESKLREQQIFQEYGFRIEREKQEAQRLKILAEGIDLYQKTLKNNLNEKLLEWKSIEASEELSKTMNEKFLLIGMRQGQMPLIVNWDGKEKGVREKTKSEERVSFSGAGVSTDSGSDTGIGHAQGAKKRLQLDKGKDREKEDA